MQENEKNMLDAWVDSLTTQELRRALKAALHAGVSPDLLFGVVRTVHAHPDSMPDHLRRTLVALAKPCTLAELAQRLRKKIKTVESYLSKLRSRGVAIRWEGRYGERKFWVESQR